MSKKRREKIKAKQRRHSDSITPKPVSPPASHQAVSKQVQPSSTNAKPHQSPQAHPLVIANKHSEHAAPIWKAFYSAVSETALRS
jgi:hypothetical protein